ncbi:MAG: hypothetical protein GX075_11880 [Firmicutes bacterium]|nr:hypothetical protein [Bacillota bacterium]
MKRIIGSLAVGFLLAACLSCHAYDWEKNGVKLLDRSESGSKTSLTLKDEKNQVFKVTYQDQTMLERVAPKVIKFKNEFYGWRRIKFSEISFMVFDNFLEVIIIPREITHRDQNIASAVPAGITMLSEPNREVMHYDFRIIKDNLFLRIEGDYLNEDELMSKLSYAYDYPSLYLKRGESPPDPNDKQSAGIDEKTRQALIYFLNEDWYGRYKAVPPETIKKVIELRQNNPWLTKNQLWKALKKEKVKLTKRELELILIIYFNEFDF